MVKPVKFIFGLWVLRVNLNSTYSLCRYLQGGQSMSSAVVEMPIWPYSDDITCRSEESFNSVWQILLAMSLKIKRWLTGSQFELREARALWETPSRGLQDLVGDHVQRQTQLTSGSYHRMNTYYASIDMVLSELELRFSRNNLLLVSV